MLRQGWKTSQVLDTQLVGTCGDVSILLVSEKPKASGVDDCTPTIVFRIVSGEATAALSTIVFNERWLYPRGKTSLVF